MGNVWRTTGDIRDSWQSMAQIGFSQSELAPYAAPGHWNDPDMLEVGNGGMTATENRTHFSLWAMIASPLLAGNDLRNMTPETREILTNKDVIAVNQDRLGKGGQRVLKAGDTEVWLKPLDQGQYAVAMFNRGEAETEVSANWAELKLAAGSYKVRDLWGHASLGQVEKGFSAKVPSHGVIMLRLAY